MNKKQSSAERPHRRPSQMPPPGAADCHMHVLGPFAHFPLAAERAYNVEEAPVEMHEAMKRAVGLERTVFVQASGHGTDNRAMLAALGGLGARARGVAVVDLGARRADLEAMHERGVRGLRINFQSMGARYAGDAARWLEGFASLVAPLGWHLQLFCNAQILAALEPAVRTCATPVVIDHMGLPDAAAGLDQPGFRRVVRLLERGHVWVKLAGADRITRSSGRLRDAVPFIRALAAAAPDRAVWGSDWPNIGFHQGKAVQDGALLPYRQLDAGELLDVLIEAVPDAGARQAILTDNPARLYGF